MRGLVVVALLLAGCASDAADEAGPSGEPSSSTDVGAPPAGSEAVEVAIDGDLGTIACYHAPPAAGGCNSFLATTLVKVASNVDEVAGNMTMTWQAADALHERLGLGLLAPRTYAEGPSCQSDQVVAVAYGTSPLALSIPRTLIEGNIGLYVCMAVEPLVDQDPVGVWASTDQTVRVEGQLQAWKT